MLYVSLDANDLFLNVAALRKHGSFLQDAVLIGMRSNQLSHARLHFFKISARNLHSEFGDVFIGLH